MGSSETAVRHTRDSRSRVCAARTCVVYSMTDIITFDLCSSSSVPKQVGSNRLLLDPTIVLLQIRLHLKMFRNLFVCLIPAAEHPT